MQRQICLDYVKISKDLAVLISVCFKIRFVSLIKYDYPDKYWAKLAQLRHSTAANYGSM